MNSNQVSKSVLISFNPTSGSGNRGELVHRLIQKLENAGFSVESPESIDCLKARTEQLTANGSLRAVVAAGGDGTVSLLVNELPTGTPISVFPLGTENLLAKYLDLRADPDQIVDVLNSGQEIRLDVGRANGKLFLVMASCGFDADVVHRLHSNRSGHIRHWSYIGPILNSIRNYRYPTLNISADGGRTQIRSKWAFIFNVPRYALNLPFVEEADPFDGELDLCAFRGGKLTRGLMYLMGVVLRQHRRWQDTSICRAKTMRIESDQPVKFQLDGDPGGELPLELDVLPGYLHMIVPAVWSPSPDLAPVRIQKTESEGIQ